MSSEEFPKPPPSFAGAVLMMLTAAAMFACLDTTTKYLTRVLGQTEDPYASQFMAGIVGTAVSALTLPFVWVMPSWQAIGLLFFAGFMGGTGHLMMIKAYGRAPASVLVPFTYSALIWVSFTGWLVFDEVPDAWTFSGMAVIASAGIYIAHRESKLRRVWEPSKPRQ